MADRVDHLALIVARKRLEVARRRRRSALYATCAEQASAARPPGLALVLRRPAGARPHVIAEIKLRSPSAGQIRARVPGEIVKLAESYAAGGATAVSVLCDGPGFGGSVLDLRRVAQKLTLPILFKEFVLDSVQLDLAKAAGASLVLLLVRLLDDAQLQRMIDETRRRGLEPVVEAADAEELARALRTTALIVGVNARDLRSFAVDSGHAAELLNRIPSDRIAVFMSGVRSREDFARVAATRADAVLVGEGLMRACDPGAELRAWLSS